MSGHVVHGVVDEKGVVVVDVVGGIEARLIGRGMLTKMKLKVYIGFSSLAF